MNKYIRISLLTVVLMLGLGLAACGSKAIDETSYVYVDINPSFELAVNAKGKVTAYHKTNDDAQVMMYQEVLVGLSIEDAIEVIVNKAIEFGYLTEKEANKMMVNAIAKTEKIQSKIETSIQTRIEKIAAKRKLAIELIENKGFTEADVTFAANLGISVYKLKLINETMQYDFELTYEAAAKMSVTELILVINENRTQLKDLISDAYMAQYLAHKKQMLEALKIGKTTITSTLANVNLLILPNFYDAYLEGSDTTKQALVLMYTNYKDDLLDYSSANTRETELEVNALIENNVEIQALISEQLTLRTEITELYQTLKGNKDKLQVIQDLKVKVMAYQNLELDLQAKVQVLVEQATIDYDYHYVYVNHTLTIYAKLDFVSHYRAVKAIHENIFIEAGFTIESFEALFEDALLNQMLDLVNTFEQEMTDALILLKSYANDYKFSIEVNFEVRRNHGSNGQ